MKKTTRLRAIVLSLAMALGMLLPAASHAQSDGFFRDGGDYANRNGGGGYSIGTQQFGSDANGGFNIGTQNFGQEAAPLGSGLIVMLAAGGAYALVRRKR